MRLSAPSLLIDINGIGGLDGIVAERRRRGNRRADAPCRRPNAPQIIAQHAPLIARAMPHIGHAAIRNRGTLGGSIAFADPAAELPACLLALDGEVDVTRPEGQAHDQGGGLLQGPVRDRARRRRDVSPRSALPAASTETRTGFAELARRHGDYAIVGLAACARARRQGAADVRLAYFGVGATPLRARKAEAALAGGDVDARCRRARSSIRRTTCRRPARRKSISPACCCARRAATRWSRGDERLLAFDITLTVNGEPSPRRVEARKTLVDFLREDLGLTGSHVGCEHGVCGACTVRVDGEIVRGCLMLAVQCDGAKVETIEGLSDSGELADLQAAFEQRNALQCGYCTPGMLPPAQDLLARGRRAEPRRNPRAHFRQLLPLHRLSRHRRRHRSRWPRKETKHARGEAMKITDDSPPLFPPSTGQTPISAAQCRGPICIASRKDAGNMSVTFRCRAWRMSLSCARRTRMRKSPRSKPIAAKTAPGVIAVVTGAELAKVMTPWVGVLTHLKGLKSAPQPPIAIDHACWQGEAVCAVVARTRAQAEDACELVEVDYRPLPAVADPETALRPETPVIHPELGDNLCFERKLDVGAVDQAFAESDAVVETTFVFGRHTGVTTEPRAIVADWNEGEQRLTVYQGTQAPHMMQNLFAKHLDLAEHQVRVLTKDVGGSFGIKVHTYADEMATVALSKLLKRPVKFVADRIESFVTDIHARDHRVRAKIGVKKDGTITAFEIDDLTGIGPYSVYPRTSRHRGKPGRQSHRRTLHLRQLSGADAGGVPKQERHVPVPRRRPSHCRRRDRRPGRTRRRQDRHGPAGNPPPQSDRRRRLSVHLRRGPQVRKAVAS